MTSTQADSSLQLIATKASISLAILVSSSSAGPDSNHLPMNLLRCIVQLMYVYSGASIPHQRAAMQGLKGRSMRTERPKCEAEGRQRGRGFGGGSEPLLTSCTVGGLGSAVSSPGLGSGRASTTNAFRAFRVQKIRQKAEDIVRSAGIFPQAILTQNMDASCAHCPFCIRP